MDSNDLFSFLDPGAADDVEDEEMDQDAPQSIVTRTENAPQKRKASTQPSNGLRNDDGNEADDPGPSTKKPRIAPANPVLLDEFETEAKREVAASAGLTGGVEAGSKLELRHQARLLFFFRCHLLHS